MTVQFAGIYRMEFNREAGPPVNLKHQEAMRKIVARNALELLRRENPQAACAALGDAGIFVFRDDERGDHFSRAKALIAPLLDARNWRRKPDGFDLSWYHPLVTNPFMAQVKETGEKLLALVNEGPVGRLAVAYEAEPRSRHYNQAQWANGAAGGSKRVQSAFRVKRITLHA